MTKEIKVYCDHIKNVCPELTKKEIDQFCDGLTVTKVGKNNFHIIAGQIQKQGGFLIQGLIRAFHVDDLGNEKNIYFIPENEYTFHYASFMDNKPSPLSFQCLESSVIVSFSMEHLHDTFKRIPKFEKYGHLIVEEKLKIQQQRLEGLLFQDAEQRYIDFINQYPQLFNRISISQMASYLGVKRQTLTRIRKKISQLK